MLVDATRHRYNNHTQMIENLHLHNALEAGQVRQPGELGGECGNAVQTRQVESLSVEVDECDDDEYNKTALVRQKMKKRIRMRSLFNVCIHIMIPLVLGCVSLALLSIQICRWIELGWNLLCEAVTPIVNANGLFFGNEIL